MAQENKRPPPPLDDQNLLPPSKREVLICPITQEPIVKPGVTLVGSVYEYEAIVRWLQDHETDPATNVILPTKHVCAVQPGENVRERAQDIKKLTLLWAPYVESMFPTGAYVRLQELQKNTNVPEWKAYSDMKVERFLSEPDDPCRYCSDIKEMDKGDVLPRPPNTGHGFQFVDLSKLFVRDRRFKGIDFSFADLTDTIFVDCDLSRCRFLGTKLERVTFVNCRFAGEQVCFYRAVAAEVTFLSCNVEYVERWVMTRDPVEILKILKRRGLELTDGRAPLVGSYQDK